MSAFRRTAVLLAAVVMLAGCTVRIGSSASPGTWEQSADQVLGTALSSLGTAELLLEGQHEGRVTRSYAVVGLRDALDVLGKVSATFLAGRPPRAAEDLDARTIALLQGSLQVVDRAATAAASGDQLDRDAALGDIRRARDEVQRFQDALPGALP